jgi:hypothetical protein
MWETKFHKHTKQPANYSSVYLILYNFGKQTGRKMILHRMIASIPWFQSALNFFMNGISLYAATQYINIISIS